MENYSTFRIAGEVFNNTWYKVRINKIWINDANPAKEYAEEILTFGNIFSYEQEALKFMEGKTYLGILKSILKTVKK